MACPAWGDRRAVGNGRGCRDRLFLPSGIASPGPGARRPCWRLAAVWRLYAGRRWPLSPPLWLLFPLQTLHAFSFGASYLGFLRYAADHAPERLAATAQAVNSALSGGLVLAGATFASGLAYAVLGTAGFAFDGDSGCARCTVRTLAGAAWRISVNYRRISRQAPVGTWANAQTIR